MKCFPILQAFEVVETPRLAQLVCEVPSLTLTAVGNVPTVDGRHPAQPGMYKTL